MAAIDLQPSRSTDPRVGRGSLWLCAYLLLAAVGVGGCQVQAKPQMTEGADTDTGGEDEEKPTPVVPGKVSRGSMLATISSASTIEAERQATIHAESTGRIVALSVEEGDKVKKGQRLARIKADAQASSLDRANTSLANAERDFNRAEQLYNSKVIGKEEFERARDTFEMAKLDVRDRNRDVRNTRVIAPFAGTITERVLIEGSFVTSGAQVFSIVDFNTLVARVYVPERELDQIKVGQIAQIVGKAAAGRKGEGKVQRIAPVVDAGTGTVKVTISLPSELAGPSGFLPGMYAEVTLTTAQHENAVLIPRSAVVRDEEQTFVFVVDGDKAKRTSIELGLHNDTEVEVLSGLEPGQVIAVAGQNGLKNDAPIALVDFQGKPLEDGEFPEANAEAGPGEAKATSEDAGESTAETKAATAKKKTGKGDK